MLLVTPIIEEMNRGDEKISFAIVFNDLHSGLTYLFNRKNILILAILSASVNFFLAAYNLVLPYGSEMFPKIAGNVYGAFLTAESLGGVIGSLVSARINRELSIKRLMICLGLSGLMLTLIPFVYSLIPNLIIICIFPDVFSLFLAVFNIQFFSFVQKDTDNQYLGRVFDTIFTLSLLFMPFGALLFTIVLKSDFRYNLAFIGSAIVITSKIFSLIYKD